MSEYNSRESRHAFVASRFKPYLSGSILNIGGGGKKHLLKYLNPKEYLELDIDGDPDIKVNLDLQYPLLIDDNNFDTVLCTDVLEHLEHFHRVFNEILRISKKYIIISLPNALNIIPNYLRELEYQPSDGSTAGDYFGLYSKFYGLPKKTPLDRHRWFFTYSEASDFFKYHEAYKYRIIEEFAVGLGGSTIKGKCTRKLLKIFINDKKFKNLFATAYWCVLEKNEDSR